MGRSATPGPGTPQKELPLGIRRNLHAACVLTALVLFGCDPAPTPIPEDVARTCDSYCEAVNLCHLPTIEYSGPPCSDFCPDDYRTAVVVSERCSLAWQEWTTCIGSLELCEGVEEYAGRDSLDSQPTCSVEYDRMEAACGDAIQGF